MRLVGLEFNLSSESNRRMSSCEWRF